MKRDRAFVLTIELYLSMTIMFVSIIVVVGLRKTVQLSAALNIKLMNRHIDFCLFV